MQTPFTPVWCLSAAGRSSALLSLPHGEMENVMRCDPLDGMFASA